MEKITVKQRDPYAFSQKLYIIECALNYLISIITSGAYLAKLTTTIGISDGLTAILSNLTSLAGIFQLVSIRLSQCKSLKHYVVPLQTGFNFLYGMIYLIPFFGWGTHVNSALFFVCVFSACVMSQISAPLKYTWFMSLPTPEKRGSFTAYVNIFSHMVGLVFSFAASMLLDYFTETENLNGMFITFTVVIFVLTALHLVSLLLAREKPRKTHKKSSVIKDLRVLLKNRRFVLLLFIFMTYAISNGIINSFIGTYQVRELGFSMMQIYILSSVTAVAAIVFLPFAGNFARKNGLLRSLLFGSPIYALSRLLITATIPSNGFVMLMIHNICSTFGSAFVTVGMEPILFEVVDEDYYTSAGAIRSIPASLMSFFTTLALTPLLNHIQSSGNMIFGIHMYAQQFFAIIACLLMLVSFGLLFIFSKSGTSEETA